MSILEKIARFLMPYKFIYDEENPEPRNRKERLERKEAMKEAKRQERLRQQVLRDNPSLKGDDKEIEKAVGSKEPVGSKPEAKQKQPVVKRATEEGSDAVKRGQLGVKIIEVTAMMTTDDAYERMSKSDTHIAYYFHDSDYHQIAVKFEPNSAWRFYERDDVARKKLKPLLFPKSNKPFDRTHVIPIGFHGSENDNRLLVGFNGDINRNSLNDFEQAVKKINNTKTILWFVSIEKQPDGSAMWKAYVWDESGKIIKGKSFHDKDKFVWN